MQYISAKEAAEKWGISERRVRALCESGRIEGVTRCGDWVWSIPAETPRPADGRTLRFIKNRDLRTGSQDYSKIDAIRSSVKKRELSDDEKVQIIRDALAFDGIEITAKKVNAILNHENQNLDLVTQVLILNMKSALDNHLHEVSENSLCSINKRLLLSVDEKAAGCYSKTGKPAQETAAMLGQYSGPWSVLHPAARSVFLFSEIMRIKPFESANTETAFVVLAHEMTKAKMPPAVFEDRISQLKAALAQTKIRGNSHELLSLVLEVASK